MKMLSAVIAAVIFLCGTILFLKLKYPSTLLLVATPLVEDGPSLFQMFQAIALSGAAVATLWLTFRRTEAINRQAENAQHQADAALKQIEINQQQLLKTGEKELQETFVIALRLLTGEKNNAMSRLASFNMLEDLAKEDTEAFYSKTKSVLMNFVISETTEIISSGNFEENASFVEIIRSIPRTKFDVYIALTTINRIQSIENNEKKSALILSNTIFSKFQFAGADLENVRFNQSCFNSVTFNNCNLSGASMERGRYVGCSFIDCDLSDAVLTGQFDGCKMIGCRVDRCTLPDGDGWTFERNKHTADSPPKVYPEVWPLYQEHIDAGRNAPKPSPLDALFVMKDAKLNDEKQGAAEAQRNRPLYVDFDKAVPAFVVIDDEESETNKDERDS